MTRHLTAWTNRASGNGWDTMVYQRSPQSLGLLLWNDMQGGLWLPTDRCLSYKDRYETRMPAVAFPIHSGHRLGVEDIHSPERKWISEDSLDSTSWPGLYKWSGSPLPYRQMQDKTSMIVDNSAPLGLKVRSRAVSLTSPHLIPLTAGVVGETWGTRCVPVFSNLFDILLSWSGWGCPFLSTVWCYRVCCFRWCRRVLSRTVVVCLFPWIHVFFLLFVGFVQPPITDIFEFKPVILENV